MKQKILIVDDKPENLFTLEDFILENLDVEVIQAESGNEALKQVLHHNFSLAILDIQMPEMDGYEASTLIRAFEKKSNLEETPIVALTANAIKGNKKKCIDSGMNYFLAKPFKKKELVEKLLICIQKSAFTSDNIKENIEEENFIEPNNKINFLDVSILKSLHNDVGSEIYTLLNSFIEQTENYKSEIKKCIDNSDYSELPKQCHGLKGCSSYIGAKDLTDTCDILAHHISNLTEHDIEKKA